MIIVNGADGPFGSYMKGAYGANAVANYAKTENQGLAFFIEGLQYSDSKEQSKLVENAFGVVLNAPFYDSNGDGKFNQTEFDSSKLNFLKFSDLDLDNDGFVNKAELTADVLARDKNKDGIVKWGEASEITKSDREAVMEQYKLNEAAVEFAKPNTLSDEQQTDLVKRTVKNSIPGFGLFGNETRSKEDYKAKSSTFYTDDRLETMFKAGDLNDDGKIDAAEDAAFTNAVDTNHDGLFNAQEIDAFKVKTDADKSDPRAIVKAISEKHDIPGQVKTEQGNQLQNLLLALFARLFGIQF